jgi:hypothetical protein
LESTEGRRIYDAVENMMGHFLRLELAPCHKEKIFPDTVFNFTERAWFDITQAQKKLVQ